MPARSEEGAAATPLTPSGPHSRSTSPWGEELPSHCSPKGELRAKRGEGVFCGSAAPYPNVSR